MGRNWKVYCTPEELSSGAFLGSNSLEALGVSLSLSATCSCRSASISSSMELFLTDIR